MAAKKSRRSGRHAAPIRIAVINAAEKTPIPDRQLAKVVAALQKQIARDLAPAWGIAAELRPVPRGGTPPRDHWWLTLHDDSDHAGELGYHDLTSAGLPLGKAFVATARADDVPWSVVLSHELLEMLIDPYINLAAVVRNGRGGVLFGYEVCDPCRLDIYRIDGVAVSNFVYPGWFEQERPHQGARFDHLGRMVKPLALRPGGYSLVNDLADKRGWRTKSASVEGKRRHLRTGTRLARRRAAKRPLRRSKPRR